MKFAGMMQHLLTQLGFHILIFAIVSLLNLIFRVHPELLPSLVMLALPFLLTNASFIKLDLSQQLAVAISLCTNAL
jgi:hypothetical protein